MFFLMLAPFCGASLVYGITYLHIISYVWALQQTELLTVNIFRLSSSVLHADPASSASGCLRVGYHEPQ